MTRASLRQCVLVAGTLCPIVACVRQSPAPSPMTVSVLVYNMHAGKDARGGDNLERVAALVRQVGADVVLLQEVDRLTTRSGGVDQPAVLGRLTGYHVAFGRTLDYQGGGYGIAVLSRAPIVRDTLVRLPVDPPQERAGGAREPRGALIATIDLPGAALRVVNTHLDASREDRWRLQEIVTVLDIARGASSSDAWATLVGGDFNSTPESATQSEVRRAGLRDAWDACGTGAGLTYPADSAVKRIDYLFLTGHAGCTEARVLASDASDHRPLLVRVTLPARAR